MSNKGVIEIQFNWIFIMFVGAIILFFFVSFGLKYKANAEVGLALTTIDQLDNILTTAGVASQTSTKITLPKQELTFTCDKESCTSQGCSSSIILFTPNGEGVSRDVSTLPLFSPSNMKRGEVTTITLPWKYPFTLSNLVYLIPDDVMIYIDISGDDGALISLNKLLRSFNISASPYATNMQFPKGVKPKVITNNPSLLSSIRDAEVFVINNNENDNSGGEITTSTGPTAFFDTATLLGAILSENNDMYECNIKKAITRYKYAQQIYERRITELESELDRLRSEQRRIFQCTYQYNSLHVSSITDDLASIKDILDYNKKEYERMNEIELRRSCPVMY